MLLRAIQLLMVDRDTPRYLASSLSRLNPIASLARFTMSATLNSCSFAGSTSGTSISPASGTNSFSFSFSGPHTGSISFSFSIFSALYRFQIKNLDISK